MWKVPQPHNLAKIFRVGVILFRPIRAVLGRSCAEAYRIRSKSGVKVGPMWAKCGPNSAKSGVNSTPSGRNCRNRSKSARCRRMSTKFGPMQRPNSVDVRPGMGQCSADVDHV